MWWQTRLLGLHPVDHQLQQGSVGGIEAGNNVFRERYAGAAQRSQQQQRTCRIQAGHTAGIHLKRLSRQPLADIGETRRERRRVRQRPVTACGATGRIVGQQELGCIGLRHARTLVEAVRAGNRKTAKSFSPPPCSKKLW